MKITKNKIYILLLIMIFIALLVFQIKYITEGKLLSDNSGNFIYIAVSHVLLTFISFSYCLYLLFMNRKNKRIIEDLFCIYFLFALIADIFFSFTNLLFIGHILFILIYLTLMIIRRAKIYEYLIALGVGSLGIIALVIAKKVTLLLSLDSFIVAILVLHLIICIKNYVKNKNKANLFIMIAVILIIISDLSIALSRIFTNNILINLSALITWPTYVAACSLLNIYYDYKRNLIE